MLGWADELRDARRARQRRHPGGCPPRARVRRRGHRAVPHRAHVHGGGSPAEDARDDHGRGRGGPARGPRPAAAAAAERLRGAVRGDGRPPVTIRLLDPPLHEFLPDQFELHEQLVRARIGERTTRAGGARARVRAAAVAVGGEPDAGHARRPARPAVPRDVRDAGAGDGSRGRRDARAHGDVAEARDHDPARRIRARARARSRTGGVGRRERRVCARAPTTPSAR